MYRRYVKVLALLLVLVLAAGVAFTGCEKKEPLKITLLSGDTTTAKQHAAAIQEMWRQNLGIEVTVDSLPFTARLQKMTDKDFQVVYAGWGPDYNDPMTFLDMFVTGGGNNHTSYSSVEYDQLIDKAKKEPDKTKRMGYLIDAEKLLMKDLPIAPIYFRNIDWIKVDDLTGVVRRAVGGDPDFYWAQTTDNKIQWNLTTEPPELDPQISTDTVSFQILGGVMEGLYRVGKDGKAIPGMASKYDLSADGKTYTFTIRDGVKWSNGDPVTADDFLYGIQRALDPKTASQYAYILYDIKGAQAINEGKAEMSTLGATVDGNKIIITLNTPVPYFLDITAFGTMMPCNKAFFESTEGKYCAEANLMLYNGPWKITTWNHEEKIILEKNDMYWNKDQIKINTIEGFMIADANTSMNMFYNKELDMVGVPGSKRDEVISKGYDILNFSDGSAWYFEFNLTDPWMKNIKIRQALSEAIDRAAFCKDIIKNSSTPALALVPPEMPGVSKTFRMEVGNLVSDLNVESAKKLFADGQKEVNKELKDKK
jgi:oligopeptide transport system substrate-binding protein